MQLETLVKEFLFECEIREYSPRTVENYKKQEIIIFILGVALGICVNFVIYAFGELIDLLDQIKENTKKAANTKEEAEDLSEILPNL